MKTAKVDVEGVKNEYSRVFAVHKQLGLSRLKLMLLMSIPGLGYMAMASVIVWKASELHDIARNAADVNTTFLAVSNLVKNLHVERGLTTLYISTGKENLKAFLELEAKQVVVDENLNKMTEWVTTEIGNLTFNSKNTFRQYLHSYRRLLKRSNMTTYDGIKFYSDITRSLIMSLTTRVALTSRGTFWKKFVAMSFLLQASDLAGIQRALGATFLANCHITRDNRFWFRSLATKTLSKQNNAFSYQPSAMRDFKEALDRVSPLMDDINLRRSEFLAERPSTCQNISMARRIDQSLYWFNNVTVYIDILNDIREDITSALIKELNTNICDTHDYLILYCMLLIVITLISACLFWVIHRLTDEIQSYSKTVAVTSKILEIEKKKVSDLYCCMVPKPIAIRMISNVKVRPHSFNCATVSFSQVTQISLIRCSSHQIVHVLNELYRTFDKIIAIYDVYKCETGGPAIMLVGGLHNGNGDAHASDIAAAAHNMIGAVSKIIIPRHSGTHLQLRVGINSGCCVAGMIRTIPPRYTLFGEMVSIASRLQAQSRGSKILISERTKALLSGPKYDTELKGMITDERKHPILTYWLKIRKEENEIS